MGARPVVSFIANKYTMLAAALVVRPLELSHDSNYDDQPRRFTLGPGERRSIANYTSAGKDVAGQISGGYSLSIKTTSAVKTIDAQTLRAALARVEKVEDNTVRAWTIENRSFCPNGASQ